MTVRYCGTIINYTHMPYKPHAGLAIVLLDDLVNINSNRIAKSTWWILGTKFVHVCVSARVVSMCAYCVLRIYQSAKTEFQATHFLDKRNRVHFASLEVINQSTRTTPRYR